MSVVRTTVRGDVGVLTSRGRVVRIGVLDLPALPPSANDPHLQGGLPVSEVLSLASGERALALTALRTDGPGLALGTRQGVVKRVNPEVLTNRDEWEVIGLRDDDEVVGAVDLQTGTETLCFITSDAQLLHFARRRRAPAGSRGRRHGRRPAGDRRAGGVVRRARPRRTSVVVTAAGSSTALPGTEPGTLKVTPFTEYPAKGRATGGVRCHRFLKGEDTLVLAWAGAAPARAAARQRLPDRPARGHGSPRRIGHPRIAAHRRVRRTGRHRRRGAHRCARLTQCRPHR